MIQFFLITHEREVPKPSNTGRLLLTDSELNARKIIWARKSPDPELLSHIEQQRVVLIYPLLDAVGHRLICLEEKQHHSTENQLASVLPPDPVVALIDATWQQAQKMFNQSSYLHGLPRLELQRERPSEFRLRRNQKPAGLCTVECAIEVLRLAGEKHRADQLQKAFYRFLRQA